MKIEEMIEKLRYKANNIKAHIEPEFFNEVADALEKQVPKKVIPYEKKLNDFLVQGYLEKGKIKKWNECPSCRKHVYKELFCRRCGQKLDRSEADEKI